VVTTGHKKQKNERKKMSNQFDEIAKGLAQSVTRRTAFTKFGLGLASMALACFGLANKARATTYQGYCQIMGDPSGPGGIYNGACVDINGCVRGSSANCPAFGTSAGPLGKVPDRACGYYYKKSKRCSFTV
jgi:hypothetical protein